MLAMFSTVAKFQLQFSVCICKFYDCAKFHYHQVAGKMLSQVKVLKILVFDHLNPINPGLLALELILGGGVFHPPSITHLSLKLDCSNFAQSYFQIG